MAEIELPKLPSTFSGFFLSLHVLLFLTSLITLLFGLPSHLDLCKKVMWISGAGVVIGAIFHYFVHPYLAAKYEDRYSWMDTLSEDVINEYLGEYLSYWFFGLIIYIITLFFILLLF